MDTAKSSTPTGPRRDYVAPAHLGPHGIEYARQLAVVAHERAEGRLTPEQANRAALSLYRSYYGG